MNQLVVTKTRDYLILKIPLKSVEEGSISVSSEEKKAIIEGLEAVRNNKTSPVFQSAKQAVSFLRNI